MKRTYSIAIILVITMILLGMFVIASAQKPAKTQPIVIKLGTPVCLSGPAAPWGQVPTPFYETFLDLFNKEGFQVGGKTYNLKLVQVDDQNTPEGGAAAAKQLIFGEGCKFIVGHWSWNFPSVSAVTNPAKVIFMARTGNEAVPGGIYSPKTMPYVVFGTPSEEVFISDLFAIVEAYPKYKKIGLLDCTLGKGPGWDYVYAVFNKAGIKYHMEWFPFGTQDFTPYITRFKEAGCDIVYIAGWIGEAMMFAKQRWEMGYKDMKVGHSGPFVDVSIYKAVCGPDAAQGFIGQYAANWEFKKTKVNPKYIAMCREAIKIVSQKTGKPYTYSGGIPWLPTHAMILAQAMQKAGTVDDPDKIMNAIRGGTFDTPVGKYTMSGEKTYGSPVVFGSAGALCTIKGDKEAYLSEHPVKPLE